MVHCARSAMVAGAAAGSYFWPRPGSVARGRRRVRTAGHRRAIAVAGGSPSRVAAGGRGRRRSVVRWWR